MSDKKPAGHRPPVEQPDPRPLVVASGREHLIAGWGCRSCGYPVAVERPWCPRCRGDLEPRRFGPQGTVWSSTVFRVPLAGRTPPWVMAYVDLDDGPRILAHARGPAERLAIGARVTIAGHTDEGDPLVSTESGEPV